MVGKLGRDRGVVAEGEFRVLAERLGDALVQGLTFTGQKVAVDGFVAEGVAERVVVMAGHEELVADGIAERVVNRRRVDGRNSAQEGVADLPADDGRGP